MIWPRFLPRSRLVRRVGPVVASLAVALVSAPAVTAAVPPVISDVRVSSPDWDPAAGALQVTAKVNAGGTWTGRFIEVCSGSVLANFSGKATVANGIALSVDPAALPGVQAGAYRVSLTPLSTDGIKGVTVDTGVSVLPTAAAASSWSWQICDNTIRWVAASTMDAQIASAIAAGRQTHPEATGVVLAPYDPKRLGDLAVAAVVARQAGLPLLLSDAAATPKAVSKELKRRQVRKVLLVGGFGKAVAAGLKSSGMQVVAATGSSPGALAASSYRKQWVKAERPAVYANLQGKPKYILQALAYANAENLLLLDASDAGWSATRKLLSAGGMKAGVAVGDKGQISEGRVSDLPGVVRVGGSTDAASLALAQSVASSASSLAVTAVGGTVSPIDMVHSAVAGSILLVVPAGGLSLEQRSWLHARGDVVSVSSSASRSSLTDSVLADVGRSVAERGAATEVPAVTPTELGSLTAPVNFSFSGSGLGHGVGLSQWGAYGMAAAGQTAEQILTTYYSGSSVAPMPDDADIYVSLQNRIRNLSLQVKSDDQSAVSMRITAYPPGEVGPVVADVLPGQSVAIGWNPVANLMTFEFKGSDTSLPDATWARVSWSGTRFADPSDIGPGLVQVAGPGESLGGGTSAGRWYRFGMLRLKAADATETLAAGIQVTNRVRLHDEYLYGIGEVSSSWPAEALRAQVIAARSYVYGDVYLSDGSLASRSGSCDCHVFDDTRDQNYVGWSKLAESAGSKWQSAVDATAADLASGLVVLSDGAVAQTFFSAASGGYTQNNEDVWNGSPRSYLRAVPDPWTLQPSSAETVSRWSPRVRSQEVVAAAFGLATVAYLDFSDRYVSGAVRSVTATSINGKTATITGDQFRLRIKSDTGSTLNSTWVWRSLVPMDSKSRKAASDLFGDRMLSLAPMPAFQAKTVVLVPISGGGEPALVAAAAAYAGARKLPLLTVAASGDSNRVLKLLSARSVSDVVAVGTVDPDVVSNLSAAGIKVRTIAGVTLGDTARKLASDLAPNPEGGALIVSDAEPTAWPLAVSVAARSGRPLLFVHAKSLPADTAMWLAEFRPAEVIAVGTPGLIPDAALAGVREPRRLNTSDLALASWAALGLGGGAVRAVAVTAVEVDPEIAVLAASTGSPLLYPDAATAGELVNWLRRQPLATCVINVQADPLYLNLFRRA